MAWLPRRAWCAGLAAVPVAGCAPRPPHDGAARARDDARLAVRFAPDRGGPLYAPEDLRARLAAVASAEFTIALGGGAIAHQRTERAPSPRLAWALTADGARALRAAAAGRRRLAGAPTGRLADDLDGALFVVELDGVRLFAGTTYARLGAAANGVPVMHPEDAPPPGVLLLGTSQGAWSYGPPGPALIDRPELRRYFAARGALEEVARLAAPL
jgi:hypothetical protein